MDEHDMTWQERRLEEILYAQSDEASKVQQIVRLGFDQEVADELVERHALGSQMPVYYETLDFDDMASEPTEESESSNVRR